jgi:surface antigen
VNPAADSRVEAQRSEAVMKRLLAILLAAASLGLAACVGPQGPGPKAQIGAAAGAASGGLIAAAAGGRAEGIIAGVLLGGLLGGAAGNLLDNQDRYYAARAAQRGLEYAPSGSRTGWINPDSGHRGSVTPRRTWQTAQGDSCREFSSEVDIDGWVEEARGIACRQPDGTWRIQ